MAKKKAVVNKSAAILEYLADNPGAPAKEVVSALGKRGIEITDKSVYNAKSKNNVRKKAEKQTVAVKKKQVAKKTARKQVKQSSVTALSADDLFEAKKLVDKLGSLDGARKAIETLEQLR